MRALPGTRWLNDEVFLCHGTPDSDLHYFLENVDPSGAVVLASRAEVAERLGAIKARVVACGHTHIPRAVRTANGTLIVNPGSVGLPAYDDDHPVPHVVENGAPDARYAIIEKHGDDWQASLLAVPYDFSRAAAAAEQRNRPDWAHALSTGYAMKLGLP
jgi:predicted phosphodiesterase